jgi:hypothetical protein
VLWNLKTKSKSSELPDKSIASSEMQPAGFVFAFKKKTKRLYSLPLPFMLFFNEYQLIIPEET